LFLKCDFSVQADITRSESAIVKNGKIIVLHNFIGIKFEVYP
jgi:hypothetical protein